MNIQTKKNIGIIHTLSANKEYIEKLAKKHLKSKRTQNNNKSSEPKPNQSPGAEITRRDLNNLSSFPKLPHIKVKNPHTNGIIKATQGKLNETEAQSNKFTLPPLKKTFDKF
jgi:hypothetical protein